MSEDSQTEEGTDEKEGEVPCLWGRHHCSNSRPFVMAKTTLHLGKEVRVIISVPHKAVECPVLAPP